jgi:hypothetical protein
MAEDTGAQTHKVRVGWPFDSHMLSSTRQALVLKALTCYLHWDLLSEPVLIQHDAIKTSP